MFNSASSEPNETGIHACKQDWCVRDITQNIGCDDQKGRKILSHTHCTHLNPSGAFVSQAGDVVIIFSIDLLRLPVFLAQEINEENMLASCSMAVIISGMSRRVLIFFRFLSAPSGEAGVRIVVQGI